MDNLTVQKKSQLFNDCINSEGNVSLVHLDIKKMYAYLAQQALNAETSRDIKYLEIAKTSLDFLVKGVIK